MLRYWDGAAWTPYISVPFGAVSPTAALAVTVAVSGRRIARHVLATHEREIAARWLEREV